MVAVRSKLAQAGAWISNLSVATRIALIGAVSFVVVSSASTAFLTHQIRSTLNQEGLNGLQTESQQVVDMLSAYDESLHSATDRLANVFAALFTYGFQRGTDTLRIGDYDTPQLMTGPDLINGDFTMVDRYTKITSGVATIFVRKGDEFIRISTSLKKEDGSRAVGTLLAHDSPAYSQLLSGQAYIGKTRLFGKDYMTKYWPLFDGQKQVIGALFIGVDFTEGLAALKRQILNLRIGATGHAYVFSGGTGPDAGNLVVHPSGEGKSFLAAKDAHGLAYVRTMLEQKNGVLRYTLPAEDGQRAREEVVAFRTFAPWKWVVVVASDAAEFEHPANTILMVELVTVPVGLALLLAFLFFGVRQSVARPLAGALAIFESIGAGNYRNPIPAAGRDEIGRLLAGLARMQTQLDRDVTEAKSVAAATLRIKRALDTSSTKVLLTDVDSRIIYINQTLLKFLQSVEDKMARLIPGFKAESLMGMSFEALRRNDGAGRSFTLAELKEPLTYQSNFGDLVLSLTTSPVFAEDGERVGTVIEIEDRTAQLAIESGIAQIVGAAVRGDFSQRLPLEGREGFFRQLSTDMNTLLETAQTGLADVQQVLEALARGDLTRTMAGDYHGAFGDLKEHTNLTVAQLHRIVSRIRSAAASMEASSSAIAAGNAELSERTESQAASLEETASSMEEFAATVRQNADNARVANQLAVDASAVARTGGAAVREAVTTMQSISSSSQKIADIIGVIDGIAFQTNILALNAAVEAARAGEQGRGFAVVASEVRALAQRSAGAAKEIKELISASVGQVDVGSKRIEAAGKTMEEVVASVQKVADIIAEISVASDQQNSGIQQVSEAISQMDQNTQQNAAQVGHAAEAAQAVRDEAAQLAEVVAVFELGEEAKVPSALASTPSAAPARIPASGAAKVRAAPKPAAPAAPVRSKPASPARPRGRTATATALESDDWAEF